jgi:hypothetical protein
MNGRVYDPMVARFMMADPGVPHPDDLQSYNRYAYACNNPLLNIDLNGFQDNKGHTVIHKSVTWPSVVKKVVNIQ